MCCTRHYASSKTSPVTPCPKREAKVASTDHTPVCYYWDLVIAECSSTMMEKQPWLLSLVQQKSYKDLLEIKPVLGIIAVCCHCHTGEQKLEVPSVSKLAESKCWQLTAWKQHVVLHVLPQKPKEQCWSHLFPCSKSPRSHLRVVSMAQKMPTGPTTQSAQDPVSIHHLENDLSNHFSLHLCSSFVFERPFCQTSLKTILRMAKKHSKFY